MKKLKEILIKQWLASFPGPVLTPYRPGNEAKQWLPWNESITAFFSWSLHIHLVAGVTDSAKYFCGITKEPT